jgi:RNA polymerase sigma-70 factor (ECF subfamily)
MEAARGTLAEAARAHERFLWGLCYRMTGVAADADELVQETYARVLSSPPERPEQLRGWLTRVATNLARDTLRRRKREGYVGPWLPSPVETDEEEAPPGVEARLPGGGTTEGRYELLESVSFAFLLALEALTPKQRAVLLLRDVFDYSVREVADCLGMSEGNVKVVHHRARAAMDAYDRERRVPTPELQSRTRQALEGFLGALFAEDVSAVEALLAGEVRALTDGGGETYASRVPLLGSERVALFFHRVANLNGAPESAEVRMMNGLPALVATYPEREDKKAATKVVIRVEIGANGRITQVHSVLASRKLTAV